MSHHSSTVVPSTMHCIELTLMTSGSTSRPQLPPVPVARNSFRIDDILGEDPARCVDVLWLASTRNKEVCKSLTPTNRQTFRQSSDRELTERPWTDDISQCHRHHYHHHQQQQQQRRRQLQQHVGSEIDQTVGLVDAVELRRHISSPVAKRPRDSTLAFSSSRHHITSGGQSSGSPPLPSPQDPLDYHVEATRPVQLRQSVSDQHDQRSPSVLLPNVTSASHSPYLPLHQHRQQQQQQQQQQKYGHVAESAAATVFGSHHPLLGVPPSSSPISAVSLHHLHTFFAGHHGALLSGCEYCLFKLTR